MLIPKKSKIRALINQSISKDSVRIHASSFIIDNKWVNFKGTTFKVSDYINSAVVPPRNSFFVNRNHAIYLLVCLDPDLGIQVREGRSVRYTTMDAVPLPETYDIIPLIGIILLQDGSRDLNLGYKPLSSANIRYFSGTGNIVEKNIMGSTGSDNPSPGAMGLMGSTGVPGYPGTTGFNGPIGMKGPTSTPVQGLTGIGGLTGISWDIDIPYEEYF